MHCLRTSDRTLCCSWRVSRKLERIWTVCGTSPLHVCIHHWAKRSVFKHVGHGKVTTRLFFPFADKNPLTVFLRISPQLVSRLVFLSVSGSIGEVSLNDPSVNWLGKLGAAGSCQRPQCRRPRTVHVSVREQRGSTPHNAWWTNFRSSAWMPYSLLLVDSDKPMWCVIEFRRPTRHFYNEGALHEMLNQDVHLSLLCCSLLPIFGYISLFPGFYSVSILDRQEPCFCAESWTHQFLYLLQG